MKTILMSWPSVPPSPTSPSPLKHSVLQLEPIVHVAVVNVPVMDDDDRHKVTAGSMVTVTVTLKRVGLLVSPDTALLEIPSDISIATL